MNFQPLIKATENLIANEEPRLIPVLEKISDGSGIESARSILAAGGAENIQTGIRPLKRAFSDDPSPSIRRVATATAVDDFPRLQLSHTELLLRSWNIFLERLLRRRTPKKYFSLTQKLRQFNGPTD